MKLIFFTIVFSLFATSVLAQEEIPLQRVTQPQTSHLFDQYNLNEISSESEKQMIELFVLQIKNTSSFAQGYIYVYKGITDYKFNADERTDNINKVLTSTLENNSIKPYRAFTRFGGFREQSTVEFIIKPAVNEHVKPTPTVSLFDVKYYDDATLPKGTIQKTWKELLNTVIKKIDPPYPAAGKAVRVSGDVGVLIKIDEKGNVIESKSFLGHPLLRNACEVAIRHWQFKAQKQKGVSVKAMGIAVCEFSLDDD